MLLYPVNNVECKCANEYVNLRLIHVPSLLSNNETLMIKKAILLYCE